MGLTTLDYAVLGGYFVLMTLIGVLSMFFVKKQEDYFLGSRSFGKIMQMFAAFGCGTNASDPVVTAKTTFTNGLSGVWSALLWLFVTPFYWICGVWFRRMRHITLGDWFQERYQSRSIALGYTIFGVVFYMVYLGVGMTAIGKMAAPLVGSDYISIFGYSAPVAELVIVLTAVCVLIYGVLGGLRAAYWTDFVQGFFIILLSVALIPVGLNALVKDENATRDANVVAATAPVDGAESTVSSDDSKRPSSMLDGFTVLHKRVPGEYFAIMTSPKGGEFPLHYILAITLLNLIGIVCQPHFIATGGGSAKTEYNARFGLVAGNLLKRFCTIGWALTALVALAYLAGNVELAEDPDKVWGVATRELLGPMNAGLVGLMLACLLAALMSSASCYMLVSSGLVVRNVYASYINKNASEKACVLAGRICGAVVIIGATVVSIMSMNVFEQLKFAWEIPIVFAAPFWIGMYWRRANKTAAWTTIVVTLILFFVIPMNVAKFDKSLTTNPKYLATNQFVVTRETRQASLTDVQRREAMRELWENRKKNIEETFFNAPDRSADWNEESRAAFLHAELGDKPKAIKIGDEIVDEFKTGGKAIYWSKGVSAYNSDGFEIVFNSDGRAVAEMQDGGKVFLGTDAPALELFDPAKRKTEQVSENCVRVVNEFKSLDELKALGVSLKGKGSFELDFLLYDACGVNLKTQSNGTLETLRLPTRLFLPFVFMILICFVTPRANKEALDRYYVKMKTPVDPDPEKDAEEMKLSYENPSRFDDKRLFKFGGLEIQRPTAVDFWGFVISLAICFAIVWALIAVANYQP